MSDEAEQPKKKRVMTPEAREKMLTNLRKGREKKARMNAERKNQKLITTDQKTDEGRDEDETTLGKTPTPLAENPSAKLTCQGCGKVYKHSSSKSKHVKKCPMVLKQLADQEHKPAEKKEPEPEPEPEVEDELEDDFDTAPRHSKHRKARKVAHKKKGRRQKITIMESESESSSSSEEDELVVHKKRRRRKNFVIQDQPAPPPPPPPPLQRTPEVPQMTQAELRRRQEQEAILRMARAMGHGGRF